MGGRLGAGVGNGYAQPLNHSFPLPTGIEKIHLDNKLVFFILLKIVF